MNIRKLLVISSYPLKTDHSLKEENGAIPCTTVAAFITPATQHTNKVYARKGKKRKKQTNKTLYKLKHFLHLVQRAIIDSLRFEESFCFVISVVEHVLQSLGHQLHL